MKTVAFIPIKLNNERTPGKNLKPFSDGTPLLSFFLRKIESIPGIDEIYVFCSDSRIKEYLPERIKYLQRPNYLDSREATPQDIIIEFMKRVDADVYMVSHCTSPFVKNSRLEECIQAVKSGKYDSAFTAQEVRKLFWNSDGTPHNFKPECVPRTQDLQPLYSEVSAAYVFLKKTFEKYGKFDEEYCLEDFEFYLRVSTTGCIRYIESVTALYRQNNNSLSKFDLSKVGIKRHQKFCRDKIKIFSKYEKYASKEQTELFFNSELDSSIGINDKEMIKEIISIMKNKGLSITAYNYFRIPVVNIGVYPIIKKVKHYFKR